MGHPLPMGLLVDPGLLDVTDRRGLVRRHEAITGPPSLGAVMRESAHCGQRPTTVPKPTERRDAAIDFPKKPNEVWTPFGPQSDSRADPANAERPYLQAFR